MPFRLNGKLLSPDRAFEHNGFSYPSNWLRLATWEEKQAIGIEEVAEEPVYDQRFFWGYDQEGMLIPKDLDELKQLHVAEVKRTAGLLLAETDWMVVRQMDAGVEMPLKVKEERTLIRQKADEKEQALLLVEDVPALAELCQSQEFAMWLPMPVIEEPVAEESTVEEVVAEEPVAEEVVAEEPLIDETK